MFKINRRRSEGGRGLERGADSPSHLSETEGLDPNEAFEVQMALAISESMTSGGSMGGKPNSLQAEALSLRYYSYGR